MKVQQFTREHWDAVLALTARMHRESKYAHIAHDERAVRAVLSDLLHNTHMHGWVACNGEGQVIGFLGVMLMPMLFTQQQTAVTLATYVAPEYRHTTAFAMLERTCERWVKAQGASSLMMGVPDISDRAQRVYNKLGFTPWEMLMRKEL